MKKFLSLVMALVMVFGCVAAMAETTEESAADKVATALGEDIAKIKAEAEKVETNVDAAIHKAIAEAEAQLVIIRMHLSVDKIEAGEEVEAAYAGFKEALTTIGAEAAKLEGEAKTNIETIVKGAEVDFALAKMWIAIEAIEVSSETKELVGKAKTGIEEGIQNIVAEAAKLSDAAKGDIEAGIEKVKEHLAALHTQLNAENIAIGEEAAKLISEATLGLKDELANIKEGAANLGAEAAKEIQSAITGVEDFMGHMLTAIKGE
jgi:hypothetical protein